MNKIWLRTISLLEIIGGISGILFVLSAAVINGFSVSYLIVAPIMLVIDGLSLAAGIYLWKRTNFGRIASIAIQFIQLPKIASAFFVFAFSFGFDIYIGFLDYKGFFTTTVQFKFLADNQLYINMDLGQSGGGISIISIIFLAILLTSSIKLEDETPVPMDADPPSPDEYFTESIEKP
jgi:hypothetical protein